MFSRRLNSLDQFYKESSFSNSARLVLQTLVEDPLKASPSEFAIALPATPLSPYQKNPSLDPQLAHRQPPLNLPLYPSFLGLFHQGVINETPGAFLISESFSLKKKKQSLKQYALQLSSASPSGWTSWASQLTPKAVCGRISTPSSCPKAETIVRSGEKFFNEDPSIAAGLLRIHFHDCFVQGCDGSVLISGASAERSTQQNSGLSGYEVVDDAQSQLEAVCPGVVSCAAILTLAARDSVDLTGGRSLSVPLGRRDGRTSLASQAASLPSPADFVAVQRKKFADKELNDHDLVTLVGARTIGQTDCLFFRYCLQNFTATRNADLTIDQDFLGQLRALCPQNGDASKRVALDAGSMSQFNVIYFKNVRDGQGVLESDQRLWDDAATASTVQKYARNVCGLLGLRFNYEFSKSIVKMSSIGVKTGNQGEIRKIVPSLTDHVSCDSETKNQSL